MDKIRRDLGVRTAGPLGVGRTPLGARRRGRRPGVSAWAAAIAFSGLLCGKAAQAQVYDVTMTLPTSVEVQDVVLGTANNLRVETFANVEGGSHSRIVNMGPVTTGISFGAKTGDVLSVANVSLEIPNISGSVTSEGSVFTAFGTTVGPVTQRAQLGRKVGPTVHVEFPTTSGASFNVLPLLTQTLSPGSYRNLNVSPTATLKLRSGTYYFNDYIVDPASTVVVDESAGPVEIYVKGTLQHMGKYKTPSGGIPNIFVGYFGIIPVYVGAAFPGTVVAPSTQVIIGTQLGGTSHVGSFFAWGIDVLPATTIKHRASDHWGIGGNAVIPTVLSRPLITDPSPPGTPSFTGTTTTSNGNTYVTGIHAKAADPEHGVFAPAFCDANDNPIPTPTDAQLNGAPPPGSTCPAMGANATNCPVTPPPTATPCTTDSDCGSGSVCAALCVDLACTTIDHRCGKPAASCGGLPADSNCQEYHMCPEEGTTGAADAEEQLSQYTPTSSVSPEGIIQEADRTTLPPFDSIAVAEQALCKDETPVYKEQADGSAKSVDDSKSKKKKKWGVYFEPTTEFGIKPNLNADKYGDLASLKGGLGFHAGGIVWTHKVEVIGAEASARADSCGVQLVASVKLFGEAVYAWTPGAAQEHHLSISEKEGAIETPKLDSEKCARARKDVKDAIHAVRQANLKAREVIEYYQTDHLTPELCESMQAELGDKMEKDPSTGEAVDCRALEGKDPAVKFNVLNAWKKEYDERTKTYLDVEKDLGVASETIKVSGTADLKLAKRHAYNLVILDQDFQIAFVTLNLAIEGYGYWDIFTGIQYGIGFSGNFTGVTDVLKNAAQGTLRVGDIRAYAGPVVTPEAGVGVLAYVGVGIPGVSVGIEGKLDLLQVGLPTSVVVATQRVSADDTRDLSGTPYAGAPKPGLLAAKYQWQTGLRWGSTLSLDELSGEIDLAARLHFLGFRKTFKHKLAAFKGFHQDFPIVSAVSGGDLSTGGDYGTQGDSTAYTEIAAVGDAINGDGVITSPAGPNMNVCSTAPPPPPPPPPPPVVL